MLIAVNARDATLAFAIDSIDPSTGSKSQLLNLTLGGAWCRSWIAWAMPGSRKYSITCTFENAPTCRNGILDIDNPGSFSWRPTVNFDNTKQYWNDAIYGDVGIYGQAILRMPSQQRVAALPDVCTTNSPPSWVQWTLLDPVNHRYIVTCSSYNPPQNPHHVMTYDLSTNQMVKRLDQGGLDRYNFPSAYFGPDASTGGVWKIGQQDSNLTISNTYTGVILSSTSIADQGTAYGIAVDNSNLPDNRVYVSATQRIVTYVCPGPGQSGVCKLLNAAQTNDNHFNLFYFPPA
jgi:hypothetical protein